MSAHASATFPSERRLAANRANAQFSTGPGTEAGKAISSVNAVKSGLTGRTGLLPGDDVEAYKSHIAHFEKTFAPVGSQERLLVQSLADTQWRLDRIPNLEAGIFALGRLRHAELFDGIDDVQLRRTMIDAHILVEDAKHLKNLYLQESRLLRRYEKEEKELKALQEARKKAEEEKEPTAKPKTLTASVGFEFTPPEPARYRNASKTPNSNGALQDLAASVGHPVPETLR